MAPWPGRWASTGLGSGVPVLSGAAGAGAEVSAEVATVVRATPAGRVHSYTAAAATTAARVSGIAQRVHAAFECSAVGSSPIVWAVGCSNGASSAGVAVPVANAPSTVVWVEADEPRVALDESAHERPARQMAVVAFLEGPHLARRELQLVGDGVDRKARCLPRGNEERAGRRARWKGSTRDGIRLRRRHSHSPVVTALASAESG